MSEVVPFPYPHAETARYCEERAVAIRQLMVKSVRAVAAIGAHLAEVEGILPPGLFPRWAEHHFGWSQETTRRYKLLARAVDDNPRILELRGIELALMFPDLPQRTQQAILDENAVRLRDARRIIKRHKIQDFRQLIEDLVPTDPGRAYHELGKARDDIDLSDAVDELLDKHAAMFAALSDMSEAGIRAEGGGQSAKRRAKAATTVGRPNARLYEEDGESRVVVWVDGQPFAIARFPKVWDLTADAWQARAIEAVVQATHARTMDDVVTEVL